MGANLLTAQVVEEQNLFVPESPCGNQGQSPWLEWYRLHKDELSVGRDADTAWLYVPVTIHLVGTNNGDGYHPIHQVMRIICDMNQQFEPARIKYYLHPTDPFLYHNNSTWNIHDWDGGAEMIQSTMIPDRLNCYLVADPAGNCGYSWMDAIVMARGCSGAGNSTWSHEAGHHFSLPHTFLGWEGEDWNYAQPAPLNLGWRDTEKVDGSNCQDAGDGFCDTPPDYLNYRWQCDQDKRSIVMQHDPDGVPFQSEAKYFMSYSFDACASVFSEEQIAAMRANIQTEHAIYLQTTEWGPLVPDDVAVQIVSPVDSAIVQYNNFTLTWLPVPNASIYHIQIAVLGNFQPIILNTTTDATSMVVQRNNFPKNSTLYWRVSPYNAWDPCVSSYSQTGIFKTRNLSSVSSVSDVAEMTIAPNPALTGTAAQLTIVSNEATDLLIEVYDAAGRVCHRITDRAYEGEEQIYDLSQGTLLAGSYFVRIQTERGAAVKPFMIVD
jgi:hypothetical protein